MNIDYNNLVTTTKEKINNKITQSIVTDKEYFYLSGQCIKYMVDCYCEINKGLEKNKNIITKKVMQSSNIKAFKNNIRQLYLKCNKYLYMNDTKFNNAFAMVVGYYPEDDKIDYNTLEYGYISNNIIK